MNERIAIDIGLDPVEELAEEFLTRRRAGERPTVEEYAARHPDLAERIRGFFPALGLVEDLKPGSVDVTGSLGGAAIPGGGRPLERFGDYRILREVGRGGMGVVYEAEQESLGRRVALKVLAASAILDPKQLVRFHREAKAAARLHNTNIVPVFGVGEHDGLHYYVMQFIQGRGLDEVLEEVKRLRGSTDPLSPTRQRGQPGPSSSATGLSSPTRQRGQPGPSSSTLAGASGSTSSLTDATGAAYPRAVARLGVQAADALEYAHAQGVLHRDVKPSNLLLDTHGTLWITDFGLAKATDSADLTHTGDIVGTVRYMAPERFQGRCDARADVYALGLTLYELLTLRPAFDHADRLRLIDQIGKLEPPRPRSVDPRIPRDLETIVMKSIDKDPCRRYQSAEALADDLRRFLADEPIAARRIGPAERLVRWGRRNPVVASLTAAVVVIAAAGFLGVFGQWQVAVANEQKANANAEQAKDERNTANQQREEVRALNEKLQRTLYVAHMNLARHTWEAGATDQVAELLEQHRPKAGETDLRGFEWYYLYRLCHAGFLTLKGHTSYVESVAFSPDGKRLASASLDKMVKVWDAQTGQELLTLKGHTTKVWGVAFSPDGKCLASAGGEELKIWDAQTGKELRTLEGRGPSVAFSPDGKRLACASRDKMVKVWDAQTGQELLSLKDASGILAFSPDGKRLASSGKVWDAQSGQKLLTLEGEVSGVAFSPDGKRLASGGKTGVRVWDAQTGQELLALKGHTGFVYSVAFSPDGKRLASGSWDGTVKVWDGQSGREILSLKGRTSDVYSVAFSPDGNRLASADGQEIKVWDAQTRLGPLTLKAHATSHFAFSPDGKRLASVSGGKPGAGDGALKVWDAQTGQELLAIKGGGFSAAFSPDGKRLACTSSDVRGTLLVWDAQTGQELLALMNAGGRSVVFSPDGKRLAITSMTALSVRDAQTGQELLTLNVGASSVAFSPDGKRLATVGGGEVKVWDAQSGKELITIKGGRDSVAYSPDGKRITTGASDSAIKVWDAQTGQELLTLKGHTGDINSVALSPDGKRLASASTTWDEVNNSYSATELKVWDAQTGQEFLSLKGGGIGVAFSPDGHRLASGAADGTVTIWDATPLPERP